MKKFLLYFFAFIFICFILPAILTKSDKIQANKDINEKQENTDKIEDSSEKYDAAIITPAANPSIASITFLLIFLKKKTILAPSIVIK